GSEDLFYQRWYRRVFSGFGPGFSQCLVDRLLDHRQEPLPPRRVETLGHPARGTSVTVGGGPGARPGPATVPPAARGARGPAQNESPPRSRRGPAPRRPGPTAASAS